MLPSYALSWGLLTITESSCQISPLSLLPFTLCYKKPSAGVGVKSQAKAFDKVKELLLSSRVLVHFDDSLPLTLSCDASPYGVGAVLSHMMPNGDVRPVSFASRTLTETEKKYAQLEKEALVIVFGVLKFHQSLYGRKFELRMDHKPLVYIFNEK